MQPLPRFFLWPADHLQTPCQQTPVKPSSHVPLLLRDVNQLAIRLDLPLTEARDKVREQRESFMRASLRRGGARSQNRPRVPP